jgi:hypothetical protein
MTEKTGKLEAINLPVKIVYFPIPILMFDFTGWLAKNIPEEYKTTLGYLIEMKLNFYKALNSLITARLEKLEEFRKELERKPKKEKVKVE